MKFDLIGAPTSKAYNEVLDEFTTEVLARKERALERVLVHVPVLEAFEWVEGDMPAVSFAAIGDRFLELRVQGTPVWRLELRFRAGVYELEELWVVASYANPLPRPVGSLGGAAPSEDAIRAELLATAEGLAELAHIEGVTDVETLIERGDEFRVEVRWSWRGGRYGLNVAFGGGRDLARLIVMRARERAGLGPDDIVPVRPFFRFRP